MSILIGGSPSTGSSLLCSILNSHPEILCGPETYLFTKPRLVRNWNRSKRFLLKRGLFGLRSPGWHMYNGTDLLDPAYGWNEEGIRSLIHEAQSFRDFYHQFFSHALAQHDKRIWAEKTPSNVYLFDSLLKLDPELLFVQTIRHPLDSIASLIARGFSVYRAVCHCLCNTLTGISLAGNSRFVIIKYEEMVDAPSESIRPVLNYFELSGKQLQLHLIKKEQGMKGWKLNPGDEISGESVGRFFELSEPLQNEILYCSRLVEINPNFSFMTQMNMCNLFDFMDHFEYSYPDHRPSGTTMSVFLESLADRVERSVRLYPTNFLNYPVKIKWKV